MLSELVVRDLGVIAELALVLDEGMTAFTGETGAGKTLVVSAIDLVVGGRADAATVRHGASEARVDARFVDADGTEVVLARVVPAEGRSRAYVDGRPVPVSTLAELGGRLVDLHGQHAHQSLLSVGAQRSALDRFGRVSLADLHEARAELARIDAALAALGGDDRARAREIDLLRFQVAELDAAGLDDADEERALAEEEALLADATAARLAGAVAHAALADDGGALDTVASAEALLAGRPAFAGLSDRLRGVLAELGDLVGEVRQTADAVEEDPERLSTVQARRAQLRELRRKYGDTLADVIAFAAECRARLTDLVGHDARAAELDVARAAAAVAVVSAEQQVAAERSRAAPGLAAAVADGLHGLAMPRAKFEIEVHGPSGDDVGFLLAANPGEPPRPLARVASGGELARTMLALRLAVTGDGAGLDGRTLVFDEVDAGIGGEAALAVAAALGDLGRSAQVLVVTHLPQVAAFAGAQVAVAKDEVDGRTLATANPVDGDERVVELSRMLAGTPGSVATRHAAAELLDAGRSRHARGSAPSAE